MDDYVRKIIDDNNRARAGFSGLVQRLVEQAKASEILDDAIEAISGDVPSDTTSDGDEGDSASELGGQAAPEEPGS